MYLRALDIRSEQDPYRHWMPAALVEGFTEPQIEDALKYLGEMKLAEVEGSLDDGEISPARITAFGQNFLSNARPYASNPTLGGLAQATINYTTNNTTTITGSTVGQLASGGTQHTFSGAVTIINHPQADALRDAFQDFDTALAQDRTLPVHVKEEVGEQVRVVRAELVKPLEEQNKEKIVGRWERVSDLIRTAPPVLEIGAAIGKLLVIAHGGHAG